MNVEESRVNQNIGSIQSATLNQDSLQFFEDNEPLQGVTEQGSTALEDDAVETKMQIISPDVLQQGEVLSLGVDQVAVGSTVLFAITNPEGDVDVASVIVSGAEDTRVTRVLDVVGRWRIDIQNNQERRTVWVNVDAPSNGSAQAQNPNVSITLENGILQASGDVVWRLAFPEASGVSSHFLEDDAHLYLIHGNSLLAVDKQVGRIEQRWILPNQGLALRSAGAGGIIVTVELDGQERSLLIEQGKMKQHLPFTDHPEVFTWLRNEAKVTDSSQRLQQDMTLPWLYVQQAQFTNDLDTKHRLFMEAVDKAHAFYTLAAFSTLFYEQGDIAAAERAFDAAMEDFLARGYDPRLLSDVDYVRRYNFPLDALGEALEQQDMAASRFFAERLWWVAPNLPEAKPLYARYSQQLVVAGRQDQARVWATRSQVDTPDVFQQNSWWYSVLHWLMRGGWGVIGALFLGFTSLCCVMSQKYQVIQVNQGGWQLRFWHFFERWNAFFLLILIASFVLLLPQGKQLRELPVGLQSGRWAQDVIAQLPIALDAIAIRESKITPDVLAYAQRYGVSSQPIATVEDIHNYLSENAASVLLQAWRAPLKSWDALVPSSWMSGWQAQFQPWLWRGLGCVYLFIVLVFFVALFVPRVQGSSHAARPWHFYLLALLVAGSGLCNMLWGGTLLLAWTLLLYELVAQWLSQSQWIHLELLHFIPLSPKQLRISLVIVYGINVLMLWLEAGLHKRLRRKVTRPLLAGTGHNISPVMSAQEPADMLPQGGYQVLRADEPQSWD